MHRKLADLYQAAGDELKAKEHHDAWLRSGMEGKVFMFAESQAKKLTDTNIATYTEAIAFMERAIERGDTESYRPKIHRTSVRFISDAAIKRRRWNISKPRCVSIQESGFRD